MRRFVSWMAVGALAIAALGIAPAGATSERPGLPGPQPEILDCAKDGNESCAECGGSMGGVPIACCYEDDCQVINKPDKPKARPRLPILWPQPGISWERAL